MIGICMGREDGLEEMLGDDIIVWVVEMGEVWGSDSGVGRVERIGLKEMGMREKLDK